MNAPKPQPRTVLTEDGELKQIDDQASTPEARLSAVFCTNCGTANPATSHFCRSCGQSLDEQVINPAALESYAPPLQKGKRDAPAMQGAPHEQTASQVAGRVIIEVIALLVMGAMTVWSASIGLGGLAVCIVFAWLMAEMLWHNWGAPK